MICLDAPSLSEGRVERDWLPVGGCFAGSSAAMEAAAAPPMCLKGRWLLVPTKIIFHVASRSLMPLPTRNSCC